MKSKLAQSQGKIIRVGLMTDDMAIKQHLEFDGKAILGYVDLGTGIDDDSLPAARNACVYMAVSLNESWKLPCAYYLIDSLSASERAQVTKLCIEKFYNIGVHVESLTFDGSACNLSMARILGANLTLGDSFDPSFINPSDSNKRVHIILDVCHMMKLIRNCLAEKRIIFDSDNNQIEWRYIVQLQDLQVTEGLRLGNKLNKCHIQWFKKK